MRAVVLDRSIDIGIAGLLVAVGLAPAFALPAIFSTRTTEIAAADEGLLVGGRLVKINDVRIARAERGMARLLVETRDGTTRTFIVASYKDAQKLMSLLPPVSAPAGLLAPRESDARSRRACPRRAAPFAEANHAGRSHHAGSRSRGGASLEPAWTATAVPTRFGLWKTRSDAVPSLGSRTTSVPLLSRMSCTHATTANMSEMSQRSATRAWMIAERSLLYGRIDSSPCWRTTITRCAGTPPSVNSLRNVDGSWTTGADAGREVRAGEVVVRADRAEELGVRLRARRQGLERDEAGDVADDEVELAVDARRAEAEVARLDDALHGRAARRLILRAAGDVEVLEVLLEPVELGAEAEAELVGVVLLGLEQDERLVRVVPVEEEVDRLRNRHSLVEHDATGAAVRVDVLAADVLEVELALLEVAAADVEVEVVDRVGAGAARGSRS